MKKIRYLAILSVMMYLVNTSSISSTHAAKSSDGENSYIPYNRSSRTSSVENSKKQTETIYKNVFENIFNSNITNTPSSPDPESATPTPKPNSSPIPTQTPGGLEINQSFTALHDLYDYVGKKVGVPTCIIEGVSYIEYPTVYTYSPGQISQYSRPGQIIPNCPWNLCSAAGHMQMTIGVDERGDTKCTRCGAGYCPNAWGTHGKAVQQYEGVSYTPNVCNLKDSTFGAAKKMKHDSETAAEDLNWSYKTMLYVGYRYYGSSTLRYERLGNRTYGEYLAYNCGL